MVELADNVAGSEATDAGHARGQEPCPKPARQRYARADHHLGKDVLPCLGGTQPVRGRRRLKHIGAKGGRALTDDDRSQDSHQDEETNDAQAKGDLGVGSKPTAQATPAAFSPQYLLGVVYRGATCSYAFP